MLHLLLYELLMGIFRPILGYNKKFGIRCVIQVYRTTEYKNHYSFSSPLYSGGIRLISCHLAICCIVPNYYYYITVVAKIIRTLVFNFQQAKNGFKSRYFYLSISSYFYLLEITDLKPFLAGKNTNHAIYIVVYLKNTMVLQLFHVQKHMR